MGKRKLVYYGEAGEKIDDVADMCCQLAELAECSVEFKFNGIDLVANQGDDWTVIRGEYFDKLDDRESRKYA